MRNGKRITVIIPAYNEQAAIGATIRAVPAWVDQVIVGNNGSTDRTADVAREAGAAVVDEPRRGYGSACLAALRSSGDTDVLVFLDADGSDDPGVMKHLVDPILSGEVDLVIGSRILGHCEPGALSPQQVFGNRLACRLIRLFWGVTFTDLGPFRAISRAAFDRLNMQDPDYGWTVEMQIKAAQRGLRCREVPVPYRKRIGKSKISGTVRGVLRAGTKILYVIFRSAIWDRKFEVKK